MRSGADDELQPCPFCGGIDLTLCDRFAYGESTRGTSVLCACGVTGPFAHHFEVDDDAFRDNLPGAMRGKLRTMARERWNSRAMISAARQG